MTRMTSDFSLLVISLLLAIGLVYIKGQEKLQERMISNVQITIENLPPNMMLPPEPWLPPTSTVQIQGPNNLVVYVRADQTSFRIDYKTIPNLEEESPITVLLTNDMFKTNLDPEDRSKISVREEYIRPRQVVIQLVPWNLDQSIPDVSTLSAEPNQVLIPVLRVEKRIPVLVSREGELEEGSQVESITTDPESIVITGRRDAVDRIKSVSTTPPIAMEYLSSAENQFTLPFQSFENTDVHPIDETIQNVTITIKLNQKK